MSDHPEWPPALRAALESPPLERGGWEWSLAPQWIGLFLWIVYFDQIPAETLRSGGVAWPVLGAALGSLLCYLLLYRSPAMWGMATRRPLGVIATSTFGIKGATWIPGLLLAGVGVVWLAVSTDYATRLILRGLVLLRLLDPTYLHPLRVGRGTTPGVLFLVASLLWCFAAAFVGRYLVRVIAALMRVFPVLPAVLLAATTILAFRGLRGAHRVGTPGAGSQADWQSGALAAKLMVQMIFGFFATAGLSSADWGRVARDPRDVRAGGWVGVVMASWIVATLAILTVAGGPASAEDGGPTTYTAAVIFLAGGPLAGVMLMAYGLGAIAPACYASFDLATRLNDIWPRVSRTRWTIVGAGLAWLLISGGKVGRLFDVFSLVGGIVAPVVGAIAADYVRSRGTWPGARSGYNAPGLCAWALGSVVGLAPWWGAIAGVGWLASAQPAAVFGFVTAFVVYLVTARWGSRPIEDPRFESYPMSVTS